MLFAWSTQLAGLVFFPGLSTPPIAGQRGHRADAQIRRDVIHQSHVESIAQDTARERCSFVPAEA